MPIPINRCVFQPSVVRIAETTMLIDGIDRAIEDIGALDAAEIKDTPLYNLMGRVLVNGGTGDDLSEYAGRQCYHSWSKGRAPAEYISNTLDQGHGSIFEHAHASFQITGVSRAFSHELVRHSVGTAISQESQRYVDAKDIRFVVPPLLAYHVADMTPEQLETDEEFTLFRKSNGRALRDYVALQSLFVKRQTARISNGATEKAITSAKKRANEAARALLPNCAETKLVYTMNLRAMRHVITLRGTEYADLEIRRVAVGLLEEGRSFAPHFFAGVEELVGNDNLPIVNAKVNRV